MVSHNGHREVFGARDSLEITTMTYNKSATECLWAQGQGLGKWYRTSYAIHVESSSLTTVRGSR
jgi:hypothetical protein